MLRFNSQPSGKRTIRRRAQCSNKKLTPSSDVSLFCRRQSEHVCLHNG